MTAFQPFHSAVNRIPVPREQAQKKGYSSDLFEDDVAPAHDHLAAERWSGSVDLKITVKTPLVFGEQGVEPSSIREVNKQGRPCVSLPVDVNGKAVVPPTMIKGMISRAFETLTCSRFRVFSGHDEPLTYRVDPAQANGLFPGVVYYDDEIQGWAIEVLNGTGTKNESALLRDSAREGVGRVYLEEHFEIKPRSGKKYPDEDQVLSEFRRRTPHGQWTRAIVTKWRGKSGPVALVTHLWDKRRKQFERFFEPPKGAGPGNEIEVYGFPCRTAPPGKYARDLYQDKKYERFFFKAQRTKDGWITRGTALELPSDVIDKYANVVRSYIEMGEQEKGRHLLNRAASCVDPDKVGELSENDLVFAVLDRKELESTNGEVARNVKVKAILPTMVGRRAYEWSPTELAAHQGVLPISSKDRASAADRVFGYVVPSPEQSAVGGDVASRGRISISAVDSSNAVISRDRRELPPLLSPKVSSARRFLTDSSGKTPLTSSGGPLRRGDYFREGQYLGSACYPVHRNQLGKNEFPKGNQEELGAKDGESSNDAVRLAVKSWIKAGSDFKCTLRYQNLSRDELAALLWVLTPENLVPEEERDASSNKVGYLRMGLGKPYGLGVVEVRMAEHSLKARSGADLANDYVLLESCDGLDRQDTSSVDFSLPKEDLLMKESWVRAMQRSAYGYAGRGEVRYMTLDENKANNLTNARTGEPKRGRGLSPRELFGEDAGAPLIVQDPDRDARKNNHNGGRQHRGGRQGGHHGNTHHHGRRH